MFIFFKYFLLKNILKYLRVCACLDKDMTCFFFFNKIHKKIKINNVKPGSDCEFS